MMHDSAPVFAAIKLCGFDMTTLSVALPLWARVLIMQAALFADDKLYWMCQRFYDERIRPAIIPRR